MRLSGTSFSSRCCQAPSLRPDHDCLLTHPCPCRWAPQSYHVAVHETGHAIYSLDSVRDVIRVSTKTLLEEPRAELTAPRPLRLPLALSLANLVGGCLFPMLVLISAG